MPFTWVKNIVYVLRVPTYLRVSKGSKSACVRAYAGEGGCQKQGLTTAPAQAPAGRLTDICSVLPVGEPPQGRMEGVGQGGAGEI